MVDTTYNRAVFIASIAFMILGGVIVFGGLIYYMVPSSNAKVSDVDHTGSSSEIDNNNNSTLYAEVFAKQRRSKWALGFIIVGFIFIILGTAGVCYFVTNTSYSGDIGKNECTMDPFCDPDDSDCFVSKNECEGILGKYEYRDGECRPLFFDGDPYYSGIDDCKEDRYRFSYDTNDKECVRNDSCKHRRGEANLNCFYTFNECANQKMTYKYIENEGCIPDSCDVRKSDCYLNKNRCEDINYNFKYNGEICERDSCIVPEKQQRSILTGIEDPICFDTLPKCHQTYYAYRCENSVCNPLEDYEECDEGDLRCFEDGYEDCQTYCGVIYQFASEMEPTQLLTNIIGRATLTVGDGERTFWHLLNSDKVFIHMMDGEAGDSIDIHLTNNDQCIDQDLLMNECSNDSIFTLTITDNNTVTLEINGLYLSNFNGDLTLTDVDDEYNKWEVIFPDG